MMTHDVARSIDADALAVIARDLSANASVEISRLSRAHELIATFEPFRRCGA